MKNKNKFLTKAAATALICAFTLLGAGCSKIPTSDLPPTTVNNYKYNSENHYFTDGTAGDTKFITVINGAVSEATNFYCNQKVTYNGLTYKVDFTFTKINGSLVAADMQENANDAYFIKVPPEQEKGFFICVNVPNGNFYPLFYDVRNCSFKDVLEGTGADKLWISDFSTSPDLKKFLLVSEKDETVYLCDPYESSLSDMKVLTGVFDLSGAIWADSKTLILTKTNESDIFETWIYDTETGNSSLTTNKYKIYDENTKQGLKLFDSRYAVNIDEKGRIYSVDIKTGTETLISGYTYDETGSMDSSAHKKGTLLLVTNTDTKKSTHTAFLLDLREGKILKQRTIPADFINVAYFDENNLIAYTSEESYSVYPMSE